MIKIITFTLSFKLLLRKIEAKCYYPSLSHKVLLVLGVQYFSLILKIGLKYYTSFLYDKKLDI